MNTVKSKKKLENFYNLINVLPYGKSAALRAVDLAEFFEVKNISHFKRKLRVLSHEGRLNGHWIIGDDSGYYLALSKDEWNLYKKRRFAALKEELTALAACDRISLSDLIKNVYAVSVDEKDYSLF